MNKFLVSSLALLMSGVMMYAADTDISTYDNVVYIESGLTVSLENDESAIIPVKMKNTVDATGFQFTLTLPAEIAASDVTIKKSTVRKADEVSFSSAVQQDGTIKVVAYSSDGEAYSGNDGEVATITIANAPEGSFAFSLTGIEVTASGTAYKTDDAVVSTVTIKTISFDEGYSVQIAPFAFTEDVDGLEFILGTQKALTNLSFDIEFPSNIGSNQLYAVSKALGTTTATTSIKDDEAGNVSVTITRKNTKTIADGATVAKLELGYDGEVLVAGVYNLKIKNIKMTDADGNEYNAAPYTASIFIGEAKAQVNDGKVILSGDYSDETMAQKLVEAIPTDNAAVTEVDLTGVTALPEGKTITVANPNALIATKIDLGLTNTKNVIIGKTCAKLELSDGNLFAAPFKFTATNATYSRDLTGFGTICLPYAPSTDGFEYYELAEDKGTTLHFTKVESPKANTPYLYKKTGTGSVITGSGVEISADGAGEADMEGDNWKMVGTYETVTLTYPTDDIYALSGGVLYHNTGNLTMKPFRAYFKKENGPTVKSVNIIVEDETTGISQTESEVRSEELGVRSYNLAGQKVAEGYKGIVIKNGKKVLVK